ncbi:hypothetical protein LWI28_013666 [Acer negundo]|uniref:Uncharacterized protein n=1 Tax=Acer negundo TaxID=4023 RepID=A0AAD5IQA8_ACENE|nr:hypothetical protein LWI28_013666 [Acer negundo]
MAYVSSIDSDTSLLVKGQTFTLYEFRRLIYFPVSPMLPTPSPSPGMPQKPASNESESVPSDADGNNLLATMDLSKMVPPPPPPPRQQPSVAGPPPIPTLQPDVLPPGISRFLPPPPPPPLDMRPPLSAPGLPGGAPHPRMMALLVPRPPFGPQPGPPPMMRPPLPPGPPPSLQEGEYVANRPSQKPSFMKSAASTVVKRPLAQHTPELTSMVEQWGLMNPIPLLI